MTDATSVEVIHRLRVITNRPDAVVARTLSLTFLFRLGSSRAADRSFARACRVAKRLFTALAVIQPAMVAVSETLELPLMRASIAVTAADQGLAGLLTQ